MCWGGGGNIKEGGPYGSGAPRGLMHYTGICSYGGVWKVQTLSTDELMENR